MVKTGYTVGLLVLMSASSAFAEAVPEKDIFPLQNGSLTITFLGHGTLMFDVKGLIIHVDPVSGYGNYSKLPKADMILITHEHSDHVDPAAVKAVSKADTVILLNQGAYDKLGKGTVLRNGGRSSFLGIDVLAVPAYNTTAGRDRFHPKGRDNGYVVTMGGKRVYIAGDTENIPEMADLGSIDIAFLPMNQPYTMTPRQVSEAAKVIKPAVLYPYHYGDTDTAELARLMERVPGVELRIRNLQ